MKKKVTKNLLRNATCDTCEYYDRYAYEDGTSETICGHPDRKNYKFPKIFTCKYWDERGSNLSYISTSNFSCEVGVQVPRKVPHQLEWKGR